MGNPLNTKDTVYWGLVAIGILELCLGIWIGTTLSVIRQKVKELSEKLDSLTANQKSSGDIQKALDQAIYLIRSGQSNTTITTTNKAGGGSSVHE